MDEAVISIHELSMTYQNVQVLQDVSLSIEKGHIHGLIGPNGAGKTTIMKLLAGIRYPTSGRIELFGSGDKLDESRTRMSFMIETPILCGALSARDNLQYIYALRGGTDPHRIDEILELVWLSHTGKKPAKQFSLGMKQRLGIGMALLPKPDGLVLDEPVNGLDPEGIVEIRQLIRRMQAEWGITVLISSHLLSELSELCTDFSILNHGRLTETLSRESLAQKCRSYLALRTNDLPQTAALLENALGIHAYQVTQDNELHIFEPLDDVANISKTITDHGFILTKLHIEGQSLEDYYLESVGERHA